MYKTICGLLKGKCRILATHQLHFLHRCDRIIWMEGGRIKCFDTYDNLMKDSDEFKLMLADTSIEQGSEKDITNPEQQELEDVKNDSTLGVTKGAELMTVEERAVKSLSFKVYGAYIKAAGGYWTLFVVLLLLTATQCSNLATSLWLSWWTANSFHYSKGKYVSINVGYFVVKTKSCHRSGYTQRSAQAKRLPCSYLLFLCQSWELVRVKISFEIRCHGYSEHLYHSLTPLHWAALRIVSLETLIHWIIISRTRFECTSSRYPRSSVLLS